ncbi:hypothetical protein [uncultured Amnibacterium sp.]|uniref:hypothetical protein n=1 Tax=uncultured Amnibacterium sp. TaxID=1631851 RepID=UPI0035C9A1F1
MNRGGSVASPVSWTETISWVLGPRDPVSRVISAVRFVFVMMVLLEVQENGSVN